MRTTRLWAVIGLLSILPAGVTWADNYNVSVDKLTGKATTYYKQAKFGRLTIVFADYDSTIGDLLMLVGSISGGDIQCRYPIRLKSADGTVHTVKTERVGTPPTCRVRIPADWVKSKVTIEAVAWGTSLLTKELQDEVKRVELDTSDLDLARIGRPIDDDSRATMTEGATASSAAVATGPSSSQSNSCLNGVGGSVEVFRVQVVSAEWTDKLLRPGMEHVPKNALEAMGEGAYARPTQKFLILKLQITNSKNAPAAWDTGYDYSHVYYLTNSQGAKFQFDPRVSDILRKAHNINLNPGIPTDGLVVFDVPQGSYKFEIDQIVKQRTSRKVYDCFLGP
jgi:hypothetical protein